jgi:hypothetical protein
MGIYVGAAAGSEIFKVSCRNWIALGGRAFSRCGCLHLHNLTNIINLTWMLVYGLGRVRYKVLSLHFPSGEYTQTITN